MTAEELRDQYWHYQRVEDEFRKNAAQARRLLAAASRDRKEAYRKWQAKLKADSK